MKVYYAEFVEWNYDDRESYVTGIFTSKELAEQAYEEAVADFEKRKDWEKKTLEPMYTEAHKKYGRRRVKNEETGEYEYDSCEERLELLRAENRRIVELKNKYGCPYYGSTDKKFYIITEYELQGE